MRFILTGRFLCVATVLALLPPASADQVFLKDGRILDGRVLGQSPKEVRIEIRKGTSLLVATYPATIVDKVVLSKPANTPSASAMPSTKAASKAAPVVPGTEPSGRKATYM